jgi:hypothetical protein
MTVNAVVVSADGRPIFWRATNHRAQMVAVRRLALSGVSGPCVDSAAIAWRLRLAATP